MVLERRDLKISKGDFDFVKQKFINL